VKKGQPLEKESKMTAKIIQFKPKIPETTKLEKIAQAISNINRIMVELNKVEEKQERGT